MTHWTEFPPEWWTERRRRDYYVDDDGEVRLDVDSATGRALSRELERAAYKVAPDITPSCWMTRQ